MSALTCGGFVEPRDLVVRWGVHRLELYGDGWKENGFHANNIACIDGLEKRDRASLPSLMAVAETAKLSSEENPSWPTTAWADSAVKMDD